MARFMFKMLFSESVTHLLNFVNSKINYLAEPGGQQITSLVMHENRFTLTLPHFIGNYELDFSWRY
jgi:hypothetical protein